MKALKTTVILIVLFLFSEMFKIKNLSVKLENFNNINYWAHKCKNCPGPKRLYEGCQESNIFDLVKCDDNVFC
jgi:hypothetical protein